MIYNKAIAFIVPLHLSFPFQVGQEPGDQSDQRHIATDIVDRFYSIMVSQIPQYGRCDPRHPESKSEKQAGDQS